MDFEKIDKLFFPEEKVFISKDHNWAFSAWEVGRLRGYIETGATLVHIDNHTDYVTPDFEIKSVTNEEEAMELGEKFDIDEFIIPAKITGTIGKLLVISNDSDYLREESPGHRAYTLNHYQHIYKRKWAEETKGKSIILDLDLDFFNYNYQDYNSDGILQTDEIIKSQLEEIKGMFEWDMVTVALSPEYCGGVEFSARLLKLFLEVFELNIKEAHRW